MSDFLLYDFKISSQLINFLIIIIDIAKQDKKRKCCHKTSII